MNTSEERLIPPTMLYRFSVPLWKAGGKWNARSGIKLTDKYRLPSFATLDGNKPFADVRVAWVDDGLFFNIDVSGKHQSVWCRETQLTESDGFQVWIDTRDTHNVHRATRFCHWFLFLPTGGGTKKDDPVGTMLRINRSREDPGTMNQFPPRVIAKQKLGGYSMKIQIPGMALNGWNTTEHPKLGFNFAVVDRELGWQTLAVGPEFPISEDPGLWQTVELTS